MILPRGGASDRTGRLASQHMGVCTHKQSSACTGLTAEDDDVVGDILMAETLTCGR
jgi:hypothetical protein